MHLQCVHCINSSTYTTDPISLLIKNRWVAVGPITWRATFPASLSISSRFSNSSVPSTNASLTFTVAVMPSVFSYPETLYSGQSTFTQLSARLNRLQLTINTNHVKFWPQKRITEETYRQQNPSRWKWQQQRRAGKHDPWRGQWHVSQMPTRSHQLWSRNGCDSCLSRERRFNSTKAAPVMTM